MSKLIKIIACIFILSLVIGCAYAADTLELPVKLDKISAEAFMGDTSIDTVIVPEGVTEIGSRAFADSSLSRIQLPSSLTAIADDAFEGVVSVSAIATEGTYAYDWCVENNVSIKNWLEETPASHFKYSERIVDGVQGWRINGCNTQLADVVVPAEIEGKPVFYIYPEYYKANEALRSIYLPDGLIFNEAGASSNLISVNYASDTDAFFGGITSLESVVIRKASETPKYTPSIDVAAFANCTNLKTVVISDDMEVIGSSAFQNCTSLTEITLPKSLQVIHNGAFDGCTNLRKVNGVYTNFSIDSTAFRNCKSLESLVLLADVSTISQSAFEGCENLTLIVMPGSDTIKQCDRLGLKYVIADYGYEVNYQLEGTLRFTAYAGTDPEMTVPAEAYGFPVSAIGYEAFKKNETIISVTVEEGISQIGMYAFRECPNLKTVILPDSVTTMETGVFYKSPALEKVVLPAGLNTIPDSILYQCTSLKEARIPATVTSIGTNAFSGCSSMETFDLPAGLTEIKNNAFRGCASVEEFVIPDGVTFIGDSAFYGCSSLESISLSDGLLSIGVSAFQECRELLSVYIPDSVTSIGKQCFQDCRKIRKVHLPASITEIPYFCFWDCYELDFVNIPEGVTAIGMSAFANCNKIDEITLPASLVSVADNAFMSASEHDRKFAVLSQSADISYSNRCLWMTKKNPVYCYSYTGAEAWAKACGFKVEYLDDNSFASVGLISLPESMRVAAGESDWVPANIFPDFGAKPVWSSDNTAVATVDQKGVITAKAKGSARITVTIGDTTATMLLDVYQPLTYFDLSASEITIEAGKTHPLSCINFEPADSDSIFSYASSNSLAASVDANGLITASAIGDATITVTSDTGVERTCIVHVVRPAA